MAFSVKSKKSGKTYYLHAKDVLLKSGRKQRIFYFASDIREDALDKLPQGYEVVENTRTGLPILRKTTKS
jgi:hypothetical protein